ncbi:MAG TPA: homoserine kinase [Vicinamibacteria bacterium]|nr:homoserine kinase [Vicinamibacteria bacterium]
MDRVTCYAPGSTSNVGPGFDCLGIAVAGIGDRVAAARAGGRGVRVLSVSDPRVPSDPARNTAALAAAEVLRRAGRTELGLELRVEKGLPLAGGLGGSAASAVAGAFAANALLGRPLDAGELLRSALEAEAVVAGRHPDNAAPSLLGGAVVVLGVEPLRYARLSVHPSLRLVFAIPGYGVETSRARSVLPARVARADAVGQASALAGLVLGLERGDGQLLREAMVDRVAEPARIPLYPGYATAREAALLAGAHGVAVSGAGPTLLAIVPAGAEEAVGRAVVSAYAREGVAATLHVAGVDGDGARLE